MSIFLVIDLWDSGTGLEMILLLIADLIQSITVPGALNPPVLINPFPFPTPHRQHNP